MCPFFYSLKQDTNYSSRKKFPSRIFNSHEKSVEKVENCKLSPYALLISISFNISY